MSSNRARSPAIVLLSGGLDSATCLAIAKRDGFSPLYTMSFDYGQRHRHELRAAERIARATNVAEHRVITIDLRQFGRSALTDDIAVPKDRPEASMAAHVPVTYVPARNTIFLSYALAWAEVIGCDHVFIGVNALDYSGYPDCRPAFIESFQQTARLGTTRTNFAVRAPLVHLTKAQIIRLGVELGVDYSLTHSCYDPDDKARACGRCDSCILRKKGFAEAGVVDPTVYQSESADPQQICELVRSASAAYDYPAVGYDPATGGDEPYDSMHQLEAHVARLLRSESCEDVLHGLSTIVYWGYYRSRGRRDFNVKRFRAEVTREQLQRSTCLFRTLSGPGLREIAALQLPGFSAISFVSKVRMFLDPARYVVLDNKLLTLRSVCPGSPLGDIRQAASESSIRISEANVGCYERWCELCRQIAARCWGSNGRAVDVERAVFALIDRGQPEGAVRIVSSLPASS